MHQLSTPIRRRVPVGIRQGRSILAIAVNGPLIVDDVEIMIRAGSDGVGPAFMSESTPSRTSQVGHSCGYTKTAPADSGLPPPPPEPSAAANRVLASHRSPRM